ncbi:unnamed protein product [Brassicogethes aeneus]|uniref:Amino acid transporter transmembrane domain-containing protein n=1 Tax=Brassicogethes aeneus TaxID=1431903 RepID=A0A9P0B9Z3_BRAAE|nr:unnamed protein product [Brassicogethes aeneus]
MITILGKTEISNIQPPFRNFGAFTHLIKGCLGAGILAMPKAFSHSGWVFGTVATLVTGICTTYCINMLIWSLVAEMKRNRLPLMTYSEACESAFNSGPKYAKKTSRCAKHSADVFLCIQLLGICAVYVLFAASNVQEILEYYGYHINFRYCIVAIWPVLILMSLIKTLKFLAPMSLVANILIILGMLIIYYNFFETMHSLDERPMIQKDWIRIPLFFGIVVFSLEGIGVVVSIENAMQNSRALIHGPCVLNVAMAIVTIMYLFTGFFGFLRYGNESDDNVSKNLPFNM